MPTNSSTISPLIMWSLRKWCLTSMCFVCKCYIRFLDRLIALELSHLMGIWLNTSPKSYKVCFIHKIWAQQLPVAIYSTLIIDMATEFCVLLTQYTSDDLRKWQVSLVLFLSTLHPIKLASKLLIKLS